MWRARGCASGEDLLVEPDEPALLADDLRLELPFGLERCVERHRPVLGHKRLPSSRCAEVLRAARRLLMRLVAENGRSARPPSPAPQTLRGSARRIRPGPAISSSAGASSFVDQLIADPLRGHPGACRRRRQPPARSTASSTSSSKAPRPPAPTVGAPAAGTPPPVLSGRPPGSLRSPGSRAAPQLLNLNVILRSSRHSDLLRSCYTVL